MRIDDHEAREAYGRYRAGDENALNILMDAYYRELIAYLAGIVGSDAAEDVAIDTFAELAFERKPLYAETAFKTFLISIGKHLAYDYLKKHKKDAFYSLEDFAESVSGLTAEDGVVREEERQLVHRALNGLHADYRSVLYLLFFERMSYRDVSIVMGKTYGQTQGMINRAKQALKEKLEGQGFRYSGG